MYALIRDLQKSIRRSWRALLICGWIVWLPVFGAAQNVWVVPDDFPDGIQSAIGSILVDDGDTILVRPGTYQENLAPVGKNLKIRSIAGPASTLIDGHGGGSVVNFESGETSVSLIEGFTLTNGTGTSTPNGICGGAVLCFQASPILRNNIFVGNSAADYGGGVCCVESNATIIDNLFHQNTAGQQGGGIACTSSSPLIQGNVIAGNHAQVYGGGLLAANGSSPLVQDNQVLQNSAGTAGGGMLCVYDAAPDIVNTLFAFNESDSGGGIGCVFDVFIDVFNCTFYGNRAEGTGGGIKVNLFSGANVANSLFWENSAEEGAEIWLGGFASMSISYSDVKGGQAGVYVSTSTLNWGGGMIDADPLLFDPAGLNFRLSAGSPCIDAGSNAAFLLPANDFEKDPRIVLGLPPGGGKELIPIGGAPSLGTVDMGADEYCRFKRSQPLELFP